VALRARLREGPSPGEAGAVEAPGIDYEAGVRVLSVSGSADEDRLLAVLRKSASSFRSLDALGLPLGDEISPEGDGAMRGLLPQVQDSSEWSSLYLPPAYDRWPS